MAERAASWENDDMGDFVKSKDWQNSLFSCAEDGTTFGYACLCPCFASAEVMINGDIGKGLVGGVLCCCHACVVTTKVRDKKQIRGSFVSDLLSFCFCYPCQLTRELREVEEKDDTTGYSY